MTKFEDLPSEIQSFFESEVDQFNEFLQRLTISRDMSKNTITCLFRMMRFLLNRFNEVEVSSEEGIIFFPPKSVYMPDDLIESFNHHEIFFSVLDASEFKSDKWYLIDINEKVISILIRGDTYHECNYLYKVFKDLEKKAKSINWAGKCQIFRSYQFD